MRSDFFKYFIKFLFIELVSWIKLRVNLKIMLILVIMISFVIMSIYIATPYFFKERVQEASLSTDDLSAQVMDKEEQFMTFAFVGDVMLGSKVGEILEQSGYDYPYKYVRKWLTEADYTIANLETPISERGKPEVKEYTYRTSPKALPALIESGVDLVNLANNHSMDYGVESLLDTMEILDTFNVKRVGAGRNIEEAYRPVIAEKNGMKIAVLGFTRVMPFITWGASSDRTGLASIYEPSRAVQAIKEIDPTVDLVIVIAHWGVERSDYPVDYQKQLAYQFIDAGADLIVGSHPHVLQGFEQYKGKWIAYSLGNFIFTTNNHPKTWETVILQAKCNNKQSCNLQVVPIITKAGQPKPMDEQSRSMLLKRLNDISIQSSVDMNGHIQLSEAQKVLKH